MESLDHVGVPVEGCQVQCSAVLEAGWRNASLLWPAGFGFMCTRCLRPGACRLADTACSKGTRSDCRTCSCCYRSCCICTARSVQDQLACTCTVPPPSSGGRIGCSRQALPGAERPAAVVYLRGQQQAAWGQGLACRLGAGSQAWRRAAALPGCRGRSCTALCRSAMIQSMPW